MEATEVKTAKDLDRYIAERDPDGRKMNRLVRAVREAGPESWYDYCQRLDREDAAVKLCETDK